MNRGADELDRFLAAASKAAQAEYRRRIEASAEQAKKLAVKPFMEPGWVVGNEKPENKSIVGMRA